MLWVSPGLAHWQTLGPRYADMAVRQDSRTFQALFLVLAARGLRAVRASIGRNIVTNRTDIQR